MPEPGFPNDTPQFGTAEFPSKDAGDICKVCRQPVTGVYYRAANNNAMLCGSCAERVQRQLPQDSHAKFVRGLVFGLGGFLAAFIAYSIIGIMLRGWTIGYLALGVGWIVGKAIMAGSGGIGGRRYQIVAVLLTYAAVSMAAAPMWVFGMRAQNSHRAAQPSSVGAEQTGTPEENLPQEQKTPHQSPMRMLGLLALLGLASPFLELQTGLGGVLMLVILFVGMQFAWKITRGHPKIQIDGPYQISSAAKA